MGAINFFFITIVIPFALTGKRTATFLQGRDKWKKKPESEYIQFDRMEILFYESTGMFDIRFGENKYLRSCHPRVEFGGKVYTPHLSRKNKYILKLENLEEGVIGATSLGKVKETIVTWVIGDTGKQVIGSVIEGLDSPFIQFKLTFPRAWNLGKAGKRKFAKPKVIFPYFENQSSNEHVLTWENGKFAPPRTHFTFAAAPVVMYDDELNSFIFSALDHFFVTGIVKGRNNAMGCGLAGSVEQIPETFSLESLLYFGKGINKSMEGWGALFRKFHGGVVKDPYGNPICARLGYNTDNGAYYYYRTERGMNYEDTMISVREQHKRIGLPVGYYQLDSWWYPKSYEKLPGILKIFLFGSALHWGEPPKKGVFPNGLRYVWEKLDKLPLMCHSRWFSPKSHYVDEYDFEVDGLLFAAPRHQDFWDDLFLKSREWGLSCYLQDWLSYQYDNIGVMKSTVDFADNWTRNMAAGAAKQGMTLQYCMAPSSFMMQTVKLPNVIQARASDDHNGLMPRRWYHPHFTVTSILCKAIGLIPHKDTFYSSRGPRADFFYKERRYELECLVANLSAGPVAPSDKIGHENKELLMKTCRTDGLLLKPDVPATAIDLMFKPHGGKYFMTSTFSEKDGGLRWHYITVMNLWAGRVKDRTFSLSDVDLDGPRAAFLHGKQTFMLLHTERDSISLDLGKGGHELIILCPELLVGVFLLGNHEKFVTCSKKQVTAVKIDEEARSIQVSIENVPDEPVPLMFFCPEKPGRVSGGEMSYVEEEKKLIVNVHVGSSGSGKVVVEF
ncbi:MAG: hypothetical protein ACTSUE_15555 [Promethearchaeota archaeon]